MKDINREFPSDTLPFEDFYDYLSDSDLEDDETELSRDYWQSGSRLSPTNAPADQPRTSKRKKKVKNKHKSALDRTTQLPI